MAQTYVEPNTKFSPGFLKELNECAEGAFGGKTQDMINSLLRKATSHLKRSFNLLYLKNITFEWIIAQLERELEIGWLENDSE